MTTRRIDSHQHFWRYRCDDYPWIGQAMEPLAQDHLPGQLHPLLTSEGVLATVPLSPAWSAGFI